MQSRYLGRLEFDEAYALQRDLWQKRVAGNIPDQLLLLEHPAVITLGRTSKSQHLLATEQRLAAQGIQVRETDRGGDVTFHGPGQLIGYPIIDLKPDRMDVLRYLRDLEEALILTLEGLGIIANRKEGYTGVWMDDRKIAAIGVKISRWVTYHGFALNVSTDLTAFDFIVPCGIRNVKVTSVQKELGRAPALQDVADLAAANMNLIFTSSEIKSVHN